MFERLLELFFHAKAGALAGLLIIGTTGALVTATVSSTNGVTTVTLTQASASPSAATLTQTSPTATPTASPATTQTTTTSSALISASTKAPQSGTMSTSCDATQAHAASDAVKTVDTAYSQYHGELSTLRKDAKTDAARTLLEDTDKLLKQIRQGAVKAIHATVSCDENDNEDANKDEDKNDDNDKADQKDTDDEQGDEDEKDDNKTSTPAAAPATTPVVTTATGDVKTIADNAVAAMKLAFDTAKSQFAAANADTTPAKAKPAKSPKDSSHSEKGKGGDDHD